MGVEQLELVGVLPSLLYSAAVNMPVIDFRRGLKTIGALSVVVALALIRTGFVVPVILTARRRRPTHEETARRFGQCSSRSRPMSASSSLRGARGSSAGCSAITPTPASTPATGWAGAAAP